MFEDNANINMTLHNFVNKIICDDYTGDLWGSIHLNQYDREDLAKEYYTGYMTHYTVDDIGGAEYTEELLKYAANKIDK